MGEMKTIAIEEYFLMPAIMGALTETEPPPSEIDIWAEYLKEREPVLPVEGVKAMDLGESRLADMDASGIDMQVLQLSGLSLSCLT